MALTAALTTLKNRHEAGWTLSVDDAKEAVRQKYVAPLIKDHGAELKNVRLLSALPDDYQILAHIVPEPVIAFDYTVKVGLVFAHYNDGQMQYAFAHGALARLFWHADAGHMQHIDAAGAIAPTDPYNALTLLETSLSSENVARVKQIFDVNFTSASWLSIYKGTLGRLKTTIDWSIQHEFHDWPKWDALLGESPSALFRISLRHPISFFSSFLEFLEKREPKSRTWRRLVDLASDHVEEIAEFLANSPLGHAAHFLTYVNNRARKEIYDGLVQHLIVEERVKLFADTALEAPLDDLPSLLDEGPLKDTDLAKSIINGIELDEWNKQRKERNFFQSDVNAIVNFARLIRKHHRIELGTVPARRLLDGLITKQLDLSKFTILQLSNILSLADLANKETAVKAHSAVTEDWLKDQYTRASPKAIAGVLHMLSSKGGRKHWTWAALPVLGARLRNFFSEPAIELDEAWLEHVSILGCFADCGGNIDSLSSVAWPDLAPAS